MRATSKPTKRAVVEEALQLLVQTRGQAGIRRLRGKVQWEGDLQAMRVDRVTDLTCSKRRPALVISPDSFNAQQQDLVVAAITSQVLKYPFDGQAPSAVASASARAECGAACARELELLSPARHGRPTFAAGGR